MAELLCSGAPRPSLNLLFLTNYFTHLQDKLDFMRPIRTQTERRYAAEPQGQLNAVQGDLQGPGMNQGSIFQ